MVNDVKTEKKKKKMKKLGEDLADRFVLTREDISVKEIILSFTTVNTLR